MEETGRRNNAEGSFFRFKPIQQFNMRNAFLSLLAAGSVLAAALAITSRANAEWQPVPSLPRAAAPVWDLKDSEGKIVKFSDFKGRVVILDFWATWCGPCRREIPGFVELQKQYGEQGLTVIGISLDEEGPAVVKPFIKKFGINYPVVMGDQKISQAFGGIEGLPTTFVIDREGRIVKKHIGYVPKEEFEKEIKPLLK